MSSLSDGPNCSGSDCVYLFEGQAALDEETVVALMKRGYRMRRFSSIARLEEAARSKQAAAVLVVSGACGTGQAEAELERDLARLCALPEPVLLIASRDSIGQRKAAQRAGVARCFFKPVDNDGLVRALACLTDREAAEPYRVMIVDDEALLLKYYCAILKKAGITTCCVREPMQALEALSEFRPELILLDIHMPDVDGLELAAIIRQDDAWAYTPIVFLSADCDQQKQLAALQVGGDDFLAKPVDESTLVETLRARLERSRWVSGLDERLRTTIKESEGLRQAIDHHDIVSIANSDGIITYANDIFCEVSGYTRDELVGANHNILNSGYHSRGFFSELWKTISGGHIWHGEICNRRKDGRQYWVYSTIVPFLDAAGKPYQYISLRTDITALRASEGRLKRSQAFANIGTWDLDIGTGNLYWSERIAPLFGYSEPVTETTYADFLKSVHPDDQGYVDDSIRACVDQGADYDIEHRVLWPDGSVHWLQERGDVVRGKNGEPLHMLGVVQDITAQKNSRTNLARAKEEAENANHAKSQFLSSMSHELRTPMNAILGFSQLLEIEDLSEMQRDSVTEISRAGHHLLELINEVLDLARVEAGNIDLSIESVNLGSVLKECHALIGTLLARFTLSMHYDAGLLEKVTVRADFMRLKQVLLNLLSNACKYNKQHGSIYVECSETAEGRVRVSIQDTGRGISADREEGLFEPFNRLGAEGTDIEGTGIGLMITRQLVELMEGCIGVETQPGEGSTFWIELPAGDSHSMEELTKDPGDGLLPETQQTERSTLLYVEDNPANVRLVSRVLEKRPDIRLLIANEPDLGLQLADTEKPDLILLDINLPGMTGYEMLARLRAGKDRCIVPVLAVSANAMPEDIEKGRQAGFDAWLSKPLDVRGFLDELDKHLQADDARV